MGHLSATEYDQLLAANRNELGPLCQEPEPRSMIKLDSFATFVGEEPNDPKCRHCGKTKGKHADSWYCFPWSAAAPKEANDQKFEREPNKTPKPTVTMNPWAGHTTPGLLHDKIEEAELIADWSKTADPAPALRAVAAGNIDVDPMVRCGMKYDPKPTPTDDPICRNCGQRKSVHHEGNGVYCFAIGAASSRKKHTQKFEPLRPDDKGFPPSDHPDRRHTIPPKFMSSVRAAEGDVDAYRRDMLMYREKFHTANEEIERLRNEQIPKERDQAWHAGYHDGKKEIRKQLPRTMENCTIEFKECEKGHGRLVPTNWLDHGCYVCILNEKDRQLGIYQTQLTEASDELQTANGRIVTLKGIESSLRDELAKADERRCDDLKMQDTAWRKKIITLKDELAESLEHYSHAYDRGYYVGADNKAKSMRYWVLFWSAWSMLAGAVLNALTHK